MFDDLSLDGKYVPDLTREEARAFREVIEALAKNPDALDDLENYLSRHFSAWLATYVRSDPKNLVAELERFAETKTLLP